MSMAAGYESGALGSPEFSTVQEQVFFMKDAVCIEASVQVIVLERGFSSSTEVWKGLFAVF